MNLSIRNKLLAGFSLILLLIALMAYFVINNFSESNQRLINIVDVSSQRVNVSNDLMTAILNITRHEKNHILANEFTQKIEYKKLIDEAWEKAEIKIIELENLIAEERKSLFNNFKYNIEKFKPYHDETVTQSTKNNSEAASEISMQQARKWREAAIEQLRNIIEFNLAEMQEDKSKNVAAYGSALNLIITLIIILLIISFIISLWITNNISKRISIIAKEAQKIAGREFLQNTFLHDAINDELSPVVNALDSINTSFKEVTTNANNVASGNYSSDFIPISENDLLGNSLKKMTVSLRETTAENQKHNWFTNGQNQLNQKLIGDQSLEELAGNTINFLCSYLNANIGAIYLLNDTSNFLTLKGKYAYATNDLTIKEIYAYNEGLIGQAAAEQKNIILNNLEQSHLRIISTVIDAQPQNLIIAPFVFEEKTLGVIEIAKLEKLTDTEIEFIKLCTDSIAISINSAISRMKIQELLEETQKQSEELQSQQEELKQMNEELEEQTQNLKQQQEELQMTNEELEEQTQALEMKNKEVEATKYEIEQKSKQLELSSKYKSEFLANMSHELRTPLNSLLILSKDLAENKRKNLDADQVESAEVIYKSGNDLLHLINEVLDLSKIEAGKMHLSIENVNLRNFINDILKSFKYQAEQKGIALSLSIADNVVEFIKTDVQRLSQILKNLLSNAIKFTEKGSVSVNIKATENNKISIAVADTGIGIAEEKQAAVFEAFQQADGGTSRKYGGTGLGLSISKELAKLLNAEIILESKLHKGSVFVLIIPVEINDSETKEYREQSLKTNLHTNTITQQNNYKNYPVIEDDRNSINKTDKLLLIIEDDLKFASILKKQANKKGFKCIAASTGEDGLILATKYMPHAIILDMDLPGINGRQVLNELKSKPALRHIPVHIISVNERSINLAKEGAIEYLTKPINKNDLERAFGRIENFINRKMKNLLIVEDDEISRKAIKKLIGNGDVKCIEAATGKDALAEYSNTHIDCIVLDLMLPDISGFELIQEFRKCKQENIPPIIVYTGKDLTKEENYELQKYAETIIIKGVKSEERLLDETALFLHRTISNLPESKQSIIHNLYDKEAIFNNKKILLVDDDMRNIFSLSKILRERGMEIIKADNGKTAIEMLTINPDIDLVLMDIMMPEMDGYEAMKKIRMQAKYKNLPIIALTAKAMKDDKQKCIDAGANDYIAKPIEIERLLSLMRVWLSK
jgi:CheY-like chemotaxis protein/CHASE3 domain sensor protein